MNQILSVDNNNSSNNYKNNKGYGSGKKADIKTIVILFCIILIIFGIFIIGNGAYSMYKNKQKDNQENLGNAPTTSEKEKITLQMVSDREIKLIVSNVNNIKSIKYSWNNDEVIEPKVKKYSNYVEIENIEVPPGTNTIHALVIDENNQEIKYEKEFTSPERPYIKLSSEENAIKVAITSKTNILNISYYWDNEEAKQEKINAPKTEKTFEINKTGEHELNITAVDDQGNEATKTKKIKVVKAPELKVTTDNQYFIIRASDEDELSKIVVNLNGTEKGKTLSQKQFEMKVPLSNGENRIIVTVYNKSGVTKQTKLKWTKE